MVCLESGEINYIPTVILENKLYTHYPIRSIERSQAEQIVCSPQFQNKIILRISQSSIRANYNVYYVATYFVSLDRPPINLIITQDYHRLHNGNLNRMLPSNLENYELLILPHSPHFSDTTITEINL